MIRKRIKHIPKNVSNEKIRDYMLSNNFVYEATLDPVFKAIMGSCPNYLADLISSITGIDKELIKNTFREKNVEYKIANALERKKTSDVIFQIKGYIINLECNNGYWDGLIERNDAYFGKIKGELLSKGEQYSKNIKVIQINFDIFDNYKKYIGNENISTFKFKNEENIIETETSAKIHIDMMESINKYYKEEPLTKLDKELVILVLDDYLEIKKLSEGDDDLMEVADKRYELTSDIDNIGLYDPEKRRKEEEALKIEYHSNIAKEQGIEKGAEERERDIAKSLLKDGISIPKVSMYTGLSEKQIAMLM